MSVAMMWNATKSRNVHVDAKTDSIDSCGKNEHSGDDDDDDDEDKSVDTKTDADMRCLSTMKRNFRTILAKEQVPQLQPPPRNDYQKNRLCL